MKPKDKDAQEKFKLCDKLVKEAAFLQAIEAEATRPISETSDTATMVVPPEYDGPRLELDHLLGGGGKSGKSPSSGDKSPEGKGGKKGGVGDGTGIVTLEFVEAVVERFRSQKTLHPKYVWNLLLVCKAIFAEEMTILEAPIPDGGELTVCGDTHGQFYDLLNIYEINGAPSPTNPYMFNGDFVDRGSFSTEVVLTLFCYKALYPKSMFLHRGNHETKNMNKIYGFDGEVKAKYTNDVADLFAEVFQFVPLGSVIANKIFVCHGGLFSKDGVTISDLRKINRVMEPPDDGPMVEMLWSDPQPQPGRSPSKRGVGVAFGPNVTKKFLKDNDLKMLVRSHEVKDEGYEVHHDGQCITIFSAPNYCDQMGNKGAFIRFGADLEPNFTQYEAVPHPQIRPMAYSNPQMASQMGF